jgi:hypothetical protein
VNPRKAEKWHRPRRESLLRGSAKAAARRHELGAPRNHRGYPATSDRCYTDEESRYLAAVAAWLARTGRRFPTACEYLAIARSLGYQPSPTLPADTDTSCNTQPGGSDRGSAG